MTLTSKTTSYGAAATSERELTEDDLALVSGGKPSAAKSSPAPKISESLSLPYEQVKFEYLVSTAAPAIGWSVRWLEWRRS